MYCQGIASLALCELYAMTKDRMLKEPAQKALLFIVNSQDQEGGGWRYRPRQSGDTSVLGWQINGTKKWRDGLLESSCHFL